MRLVVIPIGVSGLGDEDVGSLTKGVLAGVILRDKDSRLEDSDRECTSERDGVLFR